MLSTLDAWFVSFITGCLLLLFLPQLPTPEWIIFLVILCGVCVFRANWRCVGILVLGILWCLAHLLWSQRFSLAEDTYTQHRVLAKIVSLPIKGVQDWRVRLRLKRVGDAAYYLGPVVQVYWPEPSTPLAQGQVWEMDLKLKPVRGLRNPGGFSLEAWALARGICAQGKLVPGSEVLHTWSWSTRQYFYSLVRQYTQEYDTQPLILALSLGIKSGLSPDTYQVFQRTGTAHLMAISGLHIGLSFAWILLVCKAGLFGLSRVLSVTRIKRWNKGLLIFALMGAGGYACLAGFSVSSVRALVMLGCLVLPWMMGMSVSKLSLWLATFCVLLLIAPLSLLQPGFWLSITAVGLILLFLWCYPKRRKWTLLPMQLFLTLGLAPLSLFLFSGSSVLGLVANLVAIPWVSLLVMPLILMALIMSPVFNPQAIWWLVDQLLQMLLTLLTPLSELAISWLAVPGLSLFQTCVLTLVVLALLLPFRPVLKAMALCFTAFLFPEEKPQWQLYVLDVGQGTSVALEHKGHWLLYDTGASFLNGNDRAQQAILPFLRYQGARGLDVLVVSHDDRDHSGGLDSVLNSEFMPRQLITNMPITNMSVSQRRSACTAGMQWQWYEFEIRALWPVNPGFADNRDSCVLLLRHKEVHILLPGDVPASVEKRLLPDLPQHIDVVLAPHHGSKSSSSAAFVSHVAPGHLVFSRGYANQFGHPVEAVLQRYRKAQSQIWDTALHGQVRVTAVNGQLEVQSYNQNYALSWLPELFR